MSLNASKTTKFGFTLKNWAINTCIDPLLLELRISLFLAGDHGVPNDEVLLHPGGDA